MMATIISRTSTVENHEERDMIFSQQSLFKEKNKICNTKGLFLLTKAGISKNNTNVHLLSVNQKQEKEKDIY